MDKAIEQMKYRDELAGAALPAVITVWEKWRPSGGETWCEMVARISYEIADAMMKEREK